MKLSDESGARWTPISGEEMPSRMVKMQTPIYGNATVKFRCDAWNTRQACCDTGVLRLYSIFTSRALIMLSDKLESH